MTPLISPISIYNPREIAQVTQNENTIIELFETTPTQAIKQPTPTPEKSAQPKPQPKKRVSESAISFTEPYISYGFLIPGEALTRSDIVYAKTTEKNGGYLYIIQNSPPSSGASSIPNTSCDDGACNPTHASMWESPLTFGVGSRCENNPLCASDFRQEFAFRPLSPHTENHYAQVTETSLPIQITHKMNIPANQAPLPYTNTITYILIPNL